MSDGSIDSSRGAKGKTGAGRQSRHVLLRSAAPVIGALMTLNVASAQSQSTAAQTAAGGSVQLPTIDVIGEGMSSSLQTLGATLPKPKMTHAPTQSISVVERGQIEQTSPTSLLDVLATVPGVSVARAGGIGGQVYLRGFTTNSFRVPMYVDGDRFRGRNTLQLSYFSPEEIERVEVIRGPGSVVYGSEALSGLINVVTRTPKGDPNGPFRFTGGGWSAGYGTAAKSFDTYEWAQGAGHGFDVLGGVSGRWGGDYQTPDGAARNSDYRSLGGSLKLGYTPTLGQRLEFSFRKYTETDGRAGGVGGTPGYPYLQVRQSPNEVTMARLAYKGEFDSGLFREVQASTYVNYFNTTLETINNTVANRTVTSSSHVIGPVIYGGRLQGVMPFQGAFGELKTTIGTDTFREERPGSEQWSRTEVRNASGVVTSVTNSANAKSGPDTTQSNIGAFILNEWTPVSPLTVSFGGRYDWFNTTSELSPISAVMLPAFIGRDNVTNSAPTGSFGIVYRVLPMVDVLANVATSFRQPTNSEMYSSSSTTVPNPALEPEKGVTYEAGFNFHLADGNVKITGYNSRYENFLQTVSVTYQGASGYTQTQNVAEAEVKGVEIEGRWQVTPRYNVFGSAAHTYGTNLTSGTPLPYIAPFRGRVGIQYVAVDSSYSVMGVIDWATQKSRIDTAQEYETAGYAVPKIYATLHLGKLVSPKLGDTKLILGLENIFDTAYRDASTFSNRSYAQSITNPLLEVGRNFTMKLQHTF